MTAPRLHMTEQGQGPCVVLSHALGCDLGMWDAVAERLQRRWTVVRYDHRGHGSSQEPPGPWSIDMLADDAAALIAGLNRGPVHFVGLSMGGMTAQALAVRHPAAVRSITVANSASFYDEAARAMWQTRIETVRRQGLAAIAPMAMQRWFTRAFREDQRSGGAQQVARLQQRLEAMSASAYAAACEAVAAIDFRQSNARVVCPSLVIAGTLDEATPVSASEQIVTEVPGAQLRVLEAAHLSAVERPDEFVQMLETFWGRL